MIFRPPVFRKKPKGPNASHNAFYIVIRRSRITHPLAILLQELVEWRYLAMFRVLLFALIAGIGMLLTAGTTDTVTANLPWFAAFLGAIAGTGLLPNSISRRMEYRGKMCEVIAAVELYGADFEEKLLDEAGSLLTYDQFDGVGIETILDEMRSEESFARKQFAKHGKFVQRWAHWWGEER